MVLQLEHDWHYIMGIKMQ